MYSLVIQQMRCSMKCTISERAEKDVRSWRAVSLRWLSFWLWQVISLPSILCIRWCCTTVVRITSHFSGTGRCQIVVTWRGDWTYKTWKMCNLEYDGPHHRAVNAGPDKWRTKFRAGNCKTWQITDQSEGLRMQDHDIMLPIVEYVLIIH